VRILSARSLEAREEAGRILDGARREAERTRGEIEAGARAHAAAILLAARAEARRLLEAAERDLTRLAVRIAEKLVGEELRVRPETVVEIAARCLAAAGAAQRITLRVCPADVLLVEKQLERLVSIAGTELLSIQPDEEVTAGGCVVETELAEVDGRIEAQLASVLEALEDGVAKEARPR
jgi:flagellar biosynthesis/type III secretory pathway protein FliH